ncbi:MAG: phospho-sugar mutase, partial [Bacilli bacterium]
INLPSSDVIKYITETGWIVFRPSGTEPKLKIYISVRGETSKAVNQSLEGLKAAVDKLIKDKGLI